MSPQTGALGERTEKGDSRRGQKKAQQSRDKGADRAPASGHVYTDCSLADKFSPNTTHRAVAGGSSCKEQRAPVSPLCCMMTLRTSLDWDKFPNTRVASSTASTLALSSSFIITGVGENQQRGDRMRVTDAQTDPTVTACRSYAWRL